MQPASPPIEDLSYEQAFAELESVVAELESGQASLEASLTLYERGQALAQRCAQLLDQAELRVRRISEQEPDLDLESDA
jgi:exodeoxyribonuclease VII small subunit